jgi:hypothetical protein
MKLALAFFLLFAFAEGGSASPPPPPPPPPPKGEPFCVPAKLDEGIFWYTGMFKIVGSSGANGVAYAGDLSITRHGNALNLVRRVGSTITVGTGRPVKCGVESKRPMLRVAYDTKPREELFCKVDYAFGPQYRAVCTSQVPAYESNALEAWIEVYRNGP